MATYHIDRDSWQPYTIAQGGNTYIVDPDTTLTADNSTLVVNASASDTTIRVKGQIYATNGAAMTALGSDSDYAILRKGIVWGATGVALGGNGSEFSNAGVVNGVQHAGLSVTSQTSDIVNTGQITGLQHGILLGESSERQSFTLDNNGLIRGEVGIRTSAASGEIFLGENSRVVGDRIGIEAFTQSGGTTEVTNHGFITTGQTIAYRGWTGVDTFTNYGTVKGNIELEAGNDVFIDRGGRVTGIVLGGMGDDTFTVMSRKTIAVELDGQGYDTVRSSVTYSLDGHGEIERLVLTGRSNISGFGGDEDNAIQGNKGNNKLNGNGGEDILTGGRGRDTFIFTSDGATDFITDFTNNQDKIWIQGFDNYDSFDDLAITQSGDNVLIQLVQGGVTDVIVVENTRLRDIDASDFIFG